MILAIFVAILMGQKCWTLSHFTIFAVCKKNRDLGERRNVQGDRLLLLLKNEKIGNTQKWDLSHDISMTLTGKRKRPQNAVVYDTHAFFRAVRNMAISITIQLFLPSNPTLSSFRMIFSRESREFSPVPAHLGIKNTCFFPFRQNF